ncbi:PREDICTED: F-box/kelch-repeat protein At3g23880-like [Nicotiana attenuata]|uniref:F-boxkelch-repeat protein n=1 Tax=Nicotiana attenuata TaxID=49451 RepID=A0A314KTI2_NICAT|nr:PREDICTED: F-box/kelch-repeat protein At3g23880-like [Nicotiana attenuata]OIT32417.1 f-boxkelch-repeat protein [Nicotiana attenuata]
MIVKRSPSIQIEAPQKSQNLSMKLKMKQMKKKKKKSNPNEAKLANSFAPNIQNLKSQQKKRKKSVAMTIKDNLFNQIISKRQKFNEKSVLPNPICKGKSVLDNNTEQTDVDKALEIHFEEEIFMNILSRLPVQSLVQLKCVSKFLKTLISDPYFKMKHLSHAKNDPNSQKLLLSQDSPYKHDMYTFCCSLSSAQLVEDEQKLDCPLNFKPSGCRMYCCCNGLFFLGVYDGSYEHFLLWNPSTRESRVLPRPEYLNRCSTYGIGYDVTSDDYKILKIDGNVLDKSIMPYEILELKSGSWRNIGKHPDGRIVMSSLWDPVMYPLAFVHGAFHWLSAYQYMTRSSYGCYVVSFTVSNEVYGEIPVLERMCYVSNSGTDQLGISELGGMICFHSTHIHQGGCTFKLWVMKDYGVKESWTELLTIKETGLSSIRPKYMFVNGEVLLSCGRPLQYGTVFRTSTGPFGLSPQRYDTYQEGFAYTESLISPKLLT